MKRTTAHALGLHRLLTISAAGAADPDAVTETINVANFSGQTTIDVTTINGITVDNFAFIHYSYENVLTAGAGTNVEHGIRLSTDGGSSFLATNYSGLVYFGTGTVAARTTQLGIGDNGGNNYLSGVLMHINSAVPTMCKGFNASLTGLNGRHTVSRHDTAAIHNAIQFRVRSDASNVTFSSGSIHLTGYRMPASKINVQTFNLSTPAANVDYTVPPGHTYVSAIFTGVTRSVAANIRARVGLNGVLLAGASDYHTAFFNTAGETVANQADWFVSANGTAAATGLLDFMNMNTLAPVTIDAHLRGGVDSAQAGGVLNGATQANNTIRVGTLSATTMNAGTITFISYRVRTEVTQITANSGTTTQTIVTNLKKAPLVALVTHNLVMSGVGLIGMRTGINAVYDSTAGDYRRMTHIENLAVSNNTETAMTFDGQAASANHKFGASLWGMTENQFATVLWSTGSQVGAAPDPVLRSSGVRDEDKTNDSILAVSAANFTSGTIYRTDYKWN